MGCRSPAAHTSSCQPRPTPDLLLSKTRMRRACRRRRTTTSVRGTGPPAGRTAPSGTYDPRLLVQPSRAPAGALPHRNPLVERCCDGVVTAGQRSARCPVTDTSCLVLPGNCSAHGGTARFSAGSAPAQLRSPLPPSHAVGALPGHPCAALQPHPAALSRGWAAAACLPGNAGQRLGSARRSACARCAPVRAIEVQAQERRARRRKHLRGRPGHQLGAADAQLVACALCLALGLGSLPYQVPCKAPHALKMTAWMRARRLAAGRRAESGRATGAWRPCSQSTANHSARPVRPLIGAVQGAPRARLEEPCREQRRQRGIQDGAHAIPAMG